MASKKQQHDEQAEQDAKQAAAASDTPDDVEADGDPVVVDGPQYPSRGAQVRLTGQAQTAARGGLAGDIEGNTIAKKALEADGTVADGTTPDGSTRTGKPAPDVVVTEEARPGGTTPAEEGTTRVRTENTGAGEEK